MRESRFLRFSRCVFLIDNVGNWLKILGLPSTLFIFGANLELISQLNFQMLF